ncbi:hypothetical protein TREES_T100001813 [Tupaia chinensis]|uniref:Uncharacterized protein n=1 Tax=Tupaia chinensis TaxID=246437 RepID=L9KGH9_TUPCH|nr:hypothetical protein TREES_T100001813 [Tupaia chinensis]
MPASLEEIIKQEDMRRPARTWFKDPRTTLFSILQRDKLEQIQRYVPKTSERCRCCRCCHIPVQGCPPPPWLPHAVLSTGLQDALLLLRSRHQKACLETGTGVSLHSGPLLQEVLT